MNWIILALGVAALILGMFQGTKMHHELDKRGHHWEPALNVGWKAGWIGGFGMGILFTLFLYVMLSQIF